MKLPVMLYVWITTLLLATVTIMVSMDMPFNWVFYITCLGQVLLAVMVYKILTDNYVTDKTFTDFYEDRPLGNRPIN